MNRRTGSGSARLEGDLGDTARTTATRLLRPLGFVTSSAIALITRFVIAGLAVVAMILCGVSGFWGLLNWLHPSHYPFVMTFVLIAVCAAGAAMGHSILERLERSTGYSPRSRL